MGLDSVLAFQLVAGRRRTWPEAMGVIVAEGLLITLLVVTGLRQRVVLRPRLNRVATPTEVDAARSSGHPFR